ncbi:MAG: TetR family transcriptional regulator [Candidatus Dormiibacterota bacterium]
MIGSSRRQGVIEAARPLFTTNTDPSVDHILSAAGISRATFYRLFGSRDELLRELKVPPPETSRSRVLTAAMEVIGKRGFAALNMDDLAVAATVSRANLYRLFPGKPALLRELLREYSPLETVASAISAHRSEPPDVVMPALARAVGSVLGEQPGLARTLFYEVTEGGSDTSEAIEWAMQRAVATIIGYVTEQVAVGRLRPTDPLLAVQSFIGPLFFHLMTRPIAVERLGVTISVDEAMTALAEAWLRAMAPEKSVRTPTTRKKR